MKMSNAYQKAALANFLKSRHGLRLIQRGLMNGDAYYNLPYGVAYANRYGDVQLLPRNLPETHFTVRYYGQLDLKIQQGALFA